MNENNILNASVVIAAVVAAASLCAPAQTPTTQPARATTRPALSTRPAAPTQPTASSRTAAYIILGPKAKAWELCKGAIDPYHRDEQRRRFFQAAGADNELDANEFAADAAGGDGFVRTFDRWERLLEHDKNQSTTIDFSEAEAYRRAVREKVLAAYDADKDGHLTGQERDRANLALTVGWLTADGRQVFTLDFSYSGTKERMAKSMLETFDADGDGKINHEERFAIWVFMRERLRQQIMRSRHARPSPIQEAIQQWQLRLFDEDGDGALNEQEQAASREFRRKVERIFWDLRSRSMDLDGDEEISEREFLAGVRQCRRAHRQVMTMAMQQMDADGDGKLSDKERERFHQHARAAMQRWLDDFTDNCDSDADGTLSSDEREALLEGLRREMDARYTAHDTNEDGRLDAEEMVEFMEDFYRDAGLFGPWPSGRPPTTSATSEADRVSPKRLP